MNTKITINCPCCQREVVIELNVFDKDVYIDTKKVKLALEKSNIELASMKGGEKDEF